MMGSIKHHRIFDGTATAFCSSAIAILLFTNAGSYPGTEMRIRWVGAGSSLPPFIPIPYCDPFLCSCNNC